jgi:hypothetical protein
MGTCSTCLKPGLPMIIASCRPRRSATARPRGRTERTLATGPWKQGIFRGFVGLYLAAGGRSSMVVQVDRTVQFWLITDGAGNQLLGRFPTMQLARALTNMTHNEARYEAADGVRLYCQVPVVDSPTHLALHRLRQENLPALEARGIVTDLELDPDQSLAETTHMVFFRRNVVGVLYNSDGPRLKRLIGYLRNHFEIDVSFRPIIRPSVLEEIRQMRRLSFVELTLPVERTWMLDEVAEDPTEAIAALRVAAERSGAKTVKLHFGLWGADSAAMARWQHTMLSLAGGLDAFTSAKVRGKTAEGITRTFDLIQDHLTLQEPVLLMDDTVRRVREDSARDAIQAAHKALEPVINQVVPAAADRTLDFDDLKAPSADSG